MNGKFYRILKALYSEAIACEGFNEYHTNWFPISSGVKQGDALSPTLFAMYINDLIKLIKETCEPDGFLLWLHLLALMDDTVLLATSRANLVKKVQLLVQFCKKYGMVINEKKTNLMVINGNMHNRGSNYC